MLSLQNSPISHLSVNKAQAVSCCNEILSPCAQAWAHVCDMKRWGERPLCLALSQVRSQHLICFSACSEGRHAQRRLKCWGKSLVLRFLSAPTWNAEKLGEDLGMRLKLVLVIVYPKRNYWHRSRGFGLCQHKWLGNILWAIWNSTMTCRESHGTSDWWPKLNKRLHICTYGTGGSDAISTQASRQASSWAVGVLCKITRILL